MRNMRSIVLVLLAATAAAELRGRAKRQGWNVLGHVFEDWGRGRGISTLELLALTSLRICEAAQLTVPATVSWLTCLALV